MPLDRVLEPEVMDSFEEARDYDDMDHAEVNQSFVTDLLQQIPSFEEALDLGTGTAQIPIELCHRHDTCRVLAVDMAVNMLDVARYNLEAESLMDRIMLDRVDAKGLPFDDGRFSLVMSNSIIHHIPEPDTALAEAVRVTANQGWLFFRDLLRPESDAEVTKLVETYAVDANDHQRQMFEDSLRAALSIVEIRDEVEQLGFARESVQATSDRHWTWCAEKP